MNADPDVPCVTCGNGVEFVTVRPVRVCLGCGFPEPECACLPTRSPEEDARLAYPFLNFQSFREQAPGLPRVGDGEPKQGSERSSTPKAESGSKREDANSCEHRPEDLTWCDGEIRPHASTPTRDGEAANRTLPVRTVHSETKQRDGGHPLPTPTREGQSQDR